MNELQVREVELELKNLNGKDPALAWLTLRGYLTPIQALEVSKARKARFLSDHCLQALKEARAVQNARKMYLSGIVKET